MKIEKNRGGFGPLVLGISLMAALYGWIVYAGEIENDITAVTDAVAAKNPGFTLGTVTIPGITISPENILLEKTVQNTAETQQNESIKSELFASSEMAPADKMILQHFTTYCAMGVETGTCTVDPLLQFGDIKVSSVLAGTAYNPARLQAAQDFLTNLIDSPPGPKVTNFSSFGQMSAALATDPQTKASFVQALTDETILSVIRQPFVEMIAKRTIPTGDGSDGQSEMQKMEQNAIQRFMSNNWATGLAQKTALQIQQEQAIMQAFQLWLEYERYRQNERLEALLAVNALQNFKAAKGAEAAMGKAEASANSGPSTAGN